MSRRSVSLALILAAAPWAAALARRTAPPAPAPAPLQDREALFEMRRRHVLRPDAARYGAEDLTLLLRVREAEKLGAFDVLRGRFGTLKTLAVEQPVDRTYKKLWLTKEGYDMFIFVQSQNARSYFESKGHEAKDVLLSLRNLREERLFDKSGTLTQAGDEIYNRVQRGLPAYWRGKDGRVNGSARPPRDGSLPPGERAAPAAPLPQSPEEAQLLRKVAALLSTGYLEIAEAEARHLEQASGKGLAELGRESSLQVVRTAQKTYYLLSPSDPLMTVVQRLRSGGRAATPGR